ncbi:Hypothetical predicted protein [Lecanosticta acicola]|uniref:Uncharacterized protein n=1 Tax=Lecanosticta acicola TaxID=111012 RepID=A0AAI8YXT1_9PEZI|nr:Hypothetical predicted protein [Lecanosticta acicola]
MEVSKGDMKNAVKTHCDWLTLTTSSPPIYSERPLPKTKTNAQSRGPIHEVRYNNAHAELACSTRTNLVPDIVSELTQNPPTLPSIRMDRQGVLESYANYMTPVLHDLQSFESHSWSSKRLYVQLSTELSTWAIVVQDMGVKTATDLTYTNGLTQAAGGLIGGLIVYQIQGSK